MVNRYAGQCYYCGSRVAAKAGNLLKQGRTFHPVHLACHDRGERGVDVFVIGGNEYTRNRRGTCEDAPCCGCCTI